jgi:hypothetical protein
MAVRRNIFREAKLKNEELVRAGDILIILGLGFALEILLTGDCQAATAYNRSWSTGGPTAIAGPIASKVYEMLNGPVGWMGGSAGILFGIWRSFVGEWHKGVVSMVCGAALYKAPDIVTSLGAIF